MLDGLWRDKNPDSPEGPAEVLKEFHGGEVWVGGEGDELGTGTLAGNASASSWLNGSGWRENSRDVLMNFTTHSWKTVNVVTAGWSINLRGGLEGFHRERNIMGSEAQLCCQTWRLLLHCPPPPTPAHLSISSTDLSPHTCCWTRRAMLPNLSTSAVSLGSRSASRRLQWRIWKRFLSLFLFISFKLNTLRQRTLVPFRGFVGQQPLS